MEGVEELLVNIPNSIMLAILQPMLNVHDVYNSSVQKQNSINSSL
jgi:hypothetical protein